MRTALRQELAPGHPGKPMLLLLPYPPSPPTVMGIQSPTNTPASPLSGQGRCCLSRRQRLQCREEGHVAVSPPWQLGMPSPQPLLLSASPAVAMRVFKFSCVQHPWVQKHWHPGSVGCLLGRHKPEHKHTVSVQLMLADQGREKKIICYIWTF